MVHLLVKRSAKILASTSCCLVVSNAWISNNFPRYLGFRPRPEDFKEELALSGFGHETAITVFHAQEPSGVFDLLRHGEVRDRLYFFWVRFYAVRGDKMIQKQKSKFRSTVWINLWKVRTALYRSKILHINSKCPKLFQIAVSEISSRAAGIWWYALSQTKVEKYESLLSNRSGLGWEEWRTRLESSEHSPFHSISTSSPFAMRLGDQIKWRWPRLLEFLQINSQLLRYWGSLLWGAGSVDVVLSIMFSWLRDTTFGSNIVVLRGVREYVDSQRPQ